ncbi:MAG: helix-turn-helix domain-containing protein [bacterium]
MSLADVEREHILAVLRKNNWQIKKSAKELRIHRSTLYAKMKRYGIERRRS